MTTDTLTYWQGLYGTYRERSTRARRSGSETWAMIWHSMAESARRKIVSLTATGAAR